jgi:DDE superfamily endonuclease
MQHDMNEPVRSTVNVNVIYSYAVIVETANTISKQENWLSAEKIQALKFTPHWVKGMLNRAELRRRRITTDDKKILSIEEIIRVLKIGQDLIRLHGHDAATIWNMDETGITYAIGPTHLYVPWDQSRAANIGNVNTKLRITAVLTVNGLGEFAPIFLILKHSDKCISENKPDQTKMRVLDNLHKKVGFRIEENWKLEVWEKEIEVNNVIKNHKCKYLINTVTGHVITSQHKAWNDQVRMIMWFDLIILPLKEKNEKKNLFLWVDNCGSHKTELVRNYVTKNEIDVAYLPPNMTSELQVLDLVVNGPLKTHIRQLRARRIVTYLQQYLKDRKENGITTEFDVPKPELIEGICDLFNLFANEFCATKFKEGVNRSFIKTGTIPKCNGSQEISFKEYTREEKYGSIPIIPLGSSITKKKEEISDLDDSIINDITVDDAINFFDEEEEEEDDDENENDDINNDE